MLPHLVRHLGRQAGACIVHRQHHPQHLEFRVQHPPQQVEGVPELTQAFEGVVLALDWDEHGVRRRQAVHGQESQRGWTVQQDVVVLIGDPIQGDLQPGLPGEHAHQLHLGPREIHRRRRNPHIADRAFHSHRIHGGTVLETIVDRPGEAGLVDAEAARRIPLGVHIHKQHPLPQGRQAGCEVDRGGRLPHAALLVDDSYSQAHAPYTYHSAGLVCETTPSYGPQRYLSRKTARFLHMPPAV